jgi:hypothetical protein
VSEPDLAALAERAIAIGEQTARTQADIVAQRKKDRERQDEDRAYGRRNRHIIWFVAVSLLVDITVTGVTLLLFHYQSDISRQLHAQEVTQAAIIRQQAAIIAAQHRSQLNGCALGNTFRSRQQGLWDHFIAVSAIPPGETPAQRKARLERLASARAYVASAYMQIDCRKLYGK